MKTGALELSGLSLGVAKRADQPPALAPTAIDDVLPGSYRRFCIRSRNGVAYLVCRHFSTARRKVQIARLKRIKADVEEDAIELIVAEMVDCLGMFAGHALELDVTSVACGHSRRPDCLSFRLATGIAHRIATRRVHTFRPRFVRGSSHPKEFRRLPPLQFDERPRRGVLIVDDIASSGFHIHEALSAVRSAGQAAVGLVWISGARADGPE